MKDYMGIRHPNSVAVWAIDGKADPYLLTPGESQKLRNHSPDSFEWGYAGRRPAQLALAILLDFTGKPEVAIERYQEFKERYVSGLGRDTWHLRGEALTLWLSPALAKLTVAGGKDWEL